MITMRMHLLLLLVLAVLALSSPSQGKTVTSANAGGGQVEALDDWERKRSFTVCRFTSMGKEYTGTLSKTNTGKTCQRWDTQAPHKHTRNNVKDFPDGHIKHNFCRNPDNEPGGPWCYTTDKNSRWEYCDVPRCVNTNSECLVTKKGLNYVGHVKKTENGRTCQRWKDQSPHQHTRNKPEAFPDRDINHNYCRNPDNSARPWCYTTDKKKRWEYCDVAKCVRTDCSVTKRGHSYVGHTSVTEKGLKCQAWNRQSPHLHAYYRKAKEFPDNRKDHNYCRNPLQGKHAKMPWCYTTSRSARWQYCNIPTCGKSEARMTCDNSLRVWVDGKHISLPGQEQWNAVNKFDVTMDTRVIAISCRDTGGWAGFISSISGSAGRNNVTPHGWVCTKKPSDGWHSVDYKPVSPTWRRPKVIGRNGHPFFYIDGIPRTAYWVWLGMWRDMSTTNHATIYCRLRLQ